MAEEKTQPVNLQHGVKRGLLFLRGQLILDTAESPRPAPDEIRARVSRALPEGDGPPPEETFKDAAAMRRKADELRERARKRDAEAVRLLEAGDGAGAARLDFEAQSWDIMANELDKIAVEMAAMEATSAGTKPPPGEPSVVSSELWFRGMKILDTLEDPQPTMEEVSARTSRALGHEPGSTPDLGKQIREGVKRRLEEKALAKAQEPKP